MNEHPSVWGGFRHRAELLFTSTAFRRGNLIWLVRLDFLDENFDVNTFMKGEILKLCGQET